jgi:hypothetical protein
MWILWTLVSFVVLGWLGYSWMGALFTKYQHTRESISALLGLGALAILSGARIAQQIAPAWTMGPKAAVAVGVGFTLFSLFSFIAVNLWCSLLTRRFDERIASLEEEEDSILRRLDAMRWRAIRQSEFPAADLSPGKPKPVEDEASALRRVVERWEEGGGAARIRSLKVLEWREEMGGKTPAEMKEEIASLEKESLAETDEVKREQARAKAALLRLSVLEKEEPPGEEAREVPAGKAKMAEDEASFRARLQAIHGETQAQRSMRSEFLRQRIRLSWRAGK